MITYLYIYIYTYIHIGSRLVDASLNYIQTYTGRWFTKSLPKARLKAVR